MKIQIIDTGYFLADGGAMFGAIPKTAWQRRYPCNENNGCILAMRSLLVETDDGRIVLIDNGAGDKHLKQLAYYKFFGLKDLGDELQKRGIRKEEVTDLIFTHLHFDHCGYTTRLTDEKRYILSFPNATHWVSKKQWENACTPHPLEAGSYFKENIQPAADAGLVHLIDKTTTIGNSLRLCLFDGHTPGQIVPYINDGRQTYVFAGDVIPLIASVSPEWISAYDLDPRHSYHEKIRMLEEAVRERQALIYCHDAYHPCSTVKKVNDFFVKDQLISL